MEGETHLKEYEISIATHKTGAAGGRASKAEPDRALEVASGPRGPEVIGELPPRGFPINPGADHPEPQREDDQEADRGEKIAGCHDGAPPSCRAACNVFFISSAMVIGPTPPGTGVMAEHFGATSA